MDKNKILTILGARPQFIKAAALSRWLKTIKNIQEIIVHTGQHFDRNMSDVFFSEMQIPFPDYNLRISGLNHGAMTGRMMEGIEKIVLKEKPNAMLVYGDTNSTLAGALVGSKLHIPVIHVEAGLRSFNMRMPEEINRILTDRISSLLLCPTEQAITNLKNEGFESFDVQIYHVGDVMEDAALLYSQTSGERSNVISVNGLDSSEFSLLTCHRAENTNDAARMQSIIDGINEVAKVNRVVWPVHPRLAKKVKEYQLSEDILCIEPVGYFDMIELLKHCNLVLTDSGGLQKEAYFFNKFCLTIRDQTEWVELVDHGFNVLVGADSTEILTQFKRYYRKRFDSKVDLYGGGKASKKIALLIDEFLGSL